MGRPGLGARRGWGLAGEGFQFGEMESLGGVWRQLETAQTYSCRGTALKTTAALGLVRYVSPQ